MKKNMENYIEDLVLEIKEQVSLTNELFKKNNEIGSCNFVSRTTGVVSGTKIAQLVYKKINPKIQFTILKNDGDFINRGDVICVITGPVVDIFKGEKLALNFVRFMSGIASSVAKYKQELIGLDAKLLYSGHSAPGLEEFVEQAFVDGGGILVEDQKINCILTLNVTTRFDSYKDAITQVKEIDRNLKIIIEVSDIVEFEEAYLTNAQIIRVVSNKEKIIDNCSIINQNKKVLEILSEIDLKKVRNVARIGYKYIIIPSLSDASKSLPIDLCFYKRIKK